MMSKKRYKVINWKDYNTALKNRGSITFWLSDDSLSAWYNEALSGKLGRTDTYSDDSIACALKIRSFFHLPLRATQGFIDPIFALTKSGLKCADYSTLSRRCGDLQIQLNRLPSSSHLDVIIDGSGIKYYGAGEWHKSKFKNAPRRCWKKLYIAIDPVTHDTVSFTYTKQYSSEHEQLPKLLEQIPNSINSVIADGGFESYFCYKAIDDRGAKAIIPPRANASLIYKGDGKKPPPQRQRYVQAITQIGRKQWTKDVGYHKRSIVENQFFRIKKMFGERIRSKLDKNQVSEIALILQSINQFNSIGKPISIPV